MTDDQRLTETTIVDSTAINPTIPSMPPAPLGSYGSEVMPRGPLQDMFGSIDIIAGQYPPQARDATQAAFTGGTIGPGSPPDGGLGGQAEPPMPQKPPLP